MKQLYSVNVTSPTGKQFGFPIKTTEEHAESWREEGFDVAEILAIIPMWMPSWAVRPYCFLCEVWNNVRLF